MPHIALGLWLLRAVQSLRSVPHVALEVELKEHQVTWLAVDAAPGRGASAVENTKHRRHENQRCNRGTQQTTDDGASERRVLLAAFAESERHGNHADDHREGGHEHGSKARETGLDGRLHSVGMLGQPLFGERHDQNAVGGGDAHAHDRAHQRRHAERGMSEKQEDDDAGQRGGQSGNDDKRIEPGLKIDNDQQVDQDDGEAEAGQ